MPLVHLVIGHKSSVLGIQDEDEPHQSGDQATIQLIWIRPRKLCYHSTTAIRSCYESPQQLIKRSKDLPGQLGGYFRLCVAAFG